MSEEKLNCALVRDLLPLYYDQVVEPETAAAVEAHLAGCPECRARLEAMGHYFPRMGAAVEAAPSEKLLRREKKHSFLKGAVAVAATLVVGFGLWVGIWGYFPVMPVNAQYVSLGTCDFSEDGSYFLSYSVEEGHYYSGWYEDCQVEGDTLEITLRATPYRFFGGRSSTGGAVAGRASQEIRRVTCNGEVLWTAEEG